ncbi:hypothetical protein SKAU_G00351450 [Synaphobranchus kaupii]|uniref:Uncharacterized protein n=1 Tax=Synaphobranchus kaupii TaxID=118154 RepID=A0A9Q1EKK3_SYNKA|nr:hypothetical protein SKAU_G00351450 [Synaphobranchus kaupii]
MEQQQGQEAEAGSGAVAGAGLEEGPNPEPRREGEDAVISTSASSSNSDLTSAFAEGERPAIGRRHSGKTFTGLRLFGRRLRLTPKGIIPCWVGVPRQRGGSRKIKHKAPVYKYMQSYTCQTEA